MAGQIYNPDVLRSLPYPTVQNQVYFEFDHLYRWHSLIPDVLELAGGIPFPSVVFQPQMLTQVRDSLTGTEVSIKSLPTVVVGFACTVK